MPPKRFPLITAADHDDEPPTFALGDHTFTCLPVAPAAAVHALVASRPTLGAMAFIRGVLVAEDEDRFDELIARKDVIVDEPTLGDVLRYLSTEYAARPTRRSSSSQDGPPTTNDGSPAGSPREASTRP